MFPKSLLGLLLLASAAPFGNVGQAFALKWSVTCSTVWPSRTGSGRAVPREMRVNSQDAYVWQENSGVPSSAFHVIEDVRPEVATAQAPPAALTYSELAVIALRTYGKTTAAHQQLPSLRYAVTYLLRETHLNAHHSPNEAIPRDFRKALLPYDGGLIAVVRALDGQMRELATFATNLRGGWVSDCKR